jgi:hypothetical protein
MEDNIKKAYDAIVQVTEQYRGTKQEHIVLQGYLELIKGKLITEVCTCKNIVEDVKSDVSE